jgi:hypothetical protein
MNGEHHDAKAQAVLLLAVMLWDADADTRHPIFATFAPWGATTAGEIESISRWAATSFLHEQSDLRRWMDTVRTAWQTRPKSADSPTVETAENLIRCAKAYQTHLENDRYLSFGLEKRVNEAATQMGLAAPFTRADGAGENARSIYIGYNDWVGEAAGYFRIVDHQGTPLPLRGDYRKAMTATLRNLILEAEGRAAKLRAVAKGIEPAAPKSAEPAVRPKMMKNEANIKARDYLRKHPNATARQLAKGIGCSTGLVSGLPAWQGVNERRQKQRQTKKATVVSLTSKIERTAGTQDQSLARLIDEQMEDAEPSPLEDDPPDDRQGAPRKAKLYRKR